MKAMPEQTEAMEWILPTSADFDAIVARISEGAAERDADPAFPHHPFRALLEVGLLALPVPDPPQTRGRRATFEEEWRILRAVARADGSVGRIFDGHLNAVERVSVLTPEGARSSRLGRTDPGCLGSRAHPRRRCTRPYRGDRERSRARRREDVLLWLDGPGQGTRRRPGSR